MTLQAENLTLRGPRHLMSSLEKLNIALDVDSTHCLWLNDKHQITAHTSSPSSANDANLIVVRVENAESWPDTKELSADIPDDVHLLDVLLIHHKRWRSLLCTDSTCCPPDGLTIEIEKVECEKPQRAALYAQWQSWLLTSRIPEHLLGTALSSLRDLPLRDALLAQLAHEPRAMEHWVDLQATHGDIDHPAWLSILSSVFFLEEKMDRSHRLALRAIELDATYSLARLLIQAHDADAPRGIVLSAFSRYTSQELLDRANTDLVMSEDFQNSHDQK
ncbi:MAG: hypothetical protein RL410_1272 [Actinomycetota bacterium]|jgi:hypothetical protein